VPALQPLAGPAASLTDQVAASIRAAVREGSLRAGPIYSAYQLADSLGVSRSPVREALMRLAEAGVVEFARNRGFRIVIPGPRDIAEVAHLRLLLEVPAAQRAARAATPEFVAELRAELAEMHRAAAAHDEARFMQHDQRLHDLILAAAGNSRLLKLIDGLRDTTRYLGASTAEVSRTLQAICAEHEPVIDAIAAADPAAAGEAMSRHVTNTGRLLVVQAVAEASPDEDAGLMDADELWSQVVG
jgi:DNA-binding GntR family transcriptional regulator